MSNRVQAKHKICRRQGVSICGNPRCPALKKNFGPGQHGPSGRKGPGSDYSKQLRAKQQLKFYYGSLTEKAFFKLYKEAGRRKGDTSENLIGLLESRLDTLIWRAGFVPSPFAARQFVNHKHVAVNGQVINIPSYVAKVGDVIQIRATSQQIPMVLETVQSGIQAPEYLEADAKALNVKLLRVPGLSDVPYPVVMEPNLVIEFYSR
jgi:small subunit ribosomal protein S4